MTSEFEIVVELTAEEIVCEYNYDINNLASDILSMIAELDNISNPMRDKINNNNSLSDRDLLASIMTEAQEIPDWTSMVADMISALYGFKKLDNNNYEVLQ